MATRAKGADAATALGLLMVACCLAGPAVVGAVAGSAIGGWLGVLAAVVVAVAVAATVTWRRRRRDSGCSC